MYIRMCGGVKMSFRGKQITVQPNALSEGEEICMGWKCPHGESVINSENDRLVVFLIVQHQEMNFFWERQTFCARALMLEMRKTLDHRSLLSD